MDDEQKQLVSELVSGIQGGIDDGIAATGIQISDEQRERLAADLQDGIIESVTKARKERWLTGEVILRGVER